MVHTITLICLGKMSLSVIYVYIYIYISCTYRHGVMVHTITLICSGKMSLSMIYIYTYMSCTYIHAVHIHMYVHIRMNQCIQACMYVCICGTIRVTSKMKAYVLAAVNMGWLPLTNHCSNPRCDTIVHSPLENFYAWSPNSTSKPIRYVCHVLFWM